MQSAKNIGRYALVFVAVMGVLWGLMILSALIPNSAIAGNMERSALRYREADAFQFYGSDRLSSVGDNYADAILMNIAWHMGEGEPVGSTLNTRYFDGGEYGVNAGLYLSVTEGAQTNTDYTRYWHGNAAVVRVMHLITDVGGIKAVGLAAVLALAGITALMLIRSRHSDIAVLLAVSLAAVRVWNIRLSMEYEPAFVIAFALCPAYLFAERRRDGALSILSVVGGASVAFFDFLTTETVTVLLPLVLVAAVRAKEGRLGGLKYNLRLFGVCLICWGAAYGGAFLLKWTAASLATGQNTFALAAASAAERVGGAVDFYSSGDTSGGALAAVLANLTVLFGGAVRVQAGRALAGTGAMLLVLFSVWYMLRAREAKRDAAVLLLILGAVVPVRFMILNNHSYIHGFFTYRALLVPILALLLALRLNVRLPWEKRVPK